MLRIQSEFVEGFGALAELPKAVTVFGSARTPEDHPDYELGVRLGAALVKAGYAVITGGGPGLMEAANRGATRGRRLSVGLGIELPHEQRAERLHQPRHRVPVLLRPEDDVHQVRRGFVALPGGFGTLDELFEALTLVQTRKVTSFPVILMGSSSGPRSSTGSAPRLWTPASSPRRRPA